ncbi:hypothetical protein BDA96_08G080000 [Sorghum bicolor]|jgi:hypothetical protein|uniref:Uncharacterized protein n=2 Tax=Sorghum bicolor TaxID=4558 RepID=A0A921U6X1_SORBI|nr:hypothetical protein BDA96_08G080000 [Sorghum bicolor]KXG23248.1 hypothetical protein SORBI_3008G074700 [Sorghum bicolor]
MVTLPICFFIPLETIKITGQEGKENASSIRFFYPYSIRVVISCTPSYIVEPADLVVGAYRVLGTNVQESRLLIDYVWSKFKMVPD